VASATIIDEVAADHFVGGIADLRGPTIADLDDISASTPPDREDLVARAGPGASGWVKCIHGVRA